MLGGRGSSAQRPSPGDLPLTWLLTGIGAEIPTGIALRTSQHMDSVLASSLGQSSLSAARRLQQSHAQAGPAISPFQAVLPGP